MSTLSLTLVLVAAFCHALWNLAAKSSRGDATVFVWLYFSASSLLCLPVGIILLLRSGTPVGWDLVVAPVVTAVFHIAYSLLLQIGYREADMGVVYPVARGVGPLLAVVVAVLLLGERPPLAALVGGIVVLLGILVVAGGRLLQTGDDPEAGIRLCRGLRYGVLTGAAIAAYTLWDDFSVSRLGVEPVLYFGLSAAAQSLMMLPWVLRRRERIRPTWRGDRGAVAIVAVLSPVAYVLVLYALTTTSVALVAPVRESSIVIGALLAWWFFGEKDPLRRILGAVVVTAGITLVALG